MRSKAQPQSTIPRFVTLDQLVELICETVDAMPEAEKAQYLRKSRAYLEFHFFEWLKKGKVN